MNIRSHIKLRMLDNGLNMSSLSKASGVSYASIQRYLSNTSDLKSDSFIAILKALDLDVGTLFKQDEHSILLKMLPHHVKRSLIKLVRRESNGYGIE